MPHGVWDDGLPAVAFALTLLATPAAPGAAAANAEAPVAGASTDRAGARPDWRPPPMPAPRPYAGRDIAPEQAAWLADRWGIRLLGLRLTAAGYMMDFRFRVLDAGKALPLFDSRVKPYVQTERTGIKLPVPWAAKVGAFRTTNRGHNVKAGKSYYVMFGNPDSHVQRGERVSVVIGDFKIDHLTVD